VPLGTGEWEGSHCQTRSAPGKADHNWLPGPGAQPGFTAEMEGIKEGEPIKLQTASAAHLIECQVGIISGEYTGVKSEKEKIRLIGCTLHPTSTTPQQCTNEVGPTEGEIAFSAEEGSLGWINRKASPPQAGWDLKPISAEINCGRPPEEVTTDKLEGSVIGQVVKLGSMFTEFHQTYNASGGKQKPEKLEGEPPDVLTSKFRFGPGFSKEATEQTGLVAKVKIENGEPVEIKAKCIEQRLPCK